MINLLWLYAFQKYAVLLSITYTTLDASGNNISMDAAATLIHSFVVAQSTTVIVYYMMCLSAVLTSCREFKMHAPDLSLCWANSATLPPVLHQLHWLPFSFRINFKILLLTFKAIHELAPSYINDLVKLEP